MSARLNGCNNKPRPTGGTRYVAQTGWATQTSGFYMVKREPIFVFVPHRMSTTCQYDKSATDKGCAGCQHGVQA